MKAKLLARFAASAQAASAASIIGTIGTVVSIAAGSSTPIAAKFAMEKAL